MQLAEHIKEIIKHRTLVSSLVSRELKGRYRGSILGFLWTFLNPLMLLLVYALVFSVYFRIQMEHYAVFMFTGLLPWIYFSGALSDGAGAISDGGSLVTKVLFPIQVLPTVKVASNLMNFLFSLPILAGFMAFSGLKFSYVILAFPLILVAQTVFVFGLALLLSCLNVFMRDTRHILGNLLTLWFFLTPILYPLKQIPEKFRMLVYLNPAAIFTTAYQDIFYWARWPRWDVLGGLFVAGVVLLFISIKIFDRYKEYFAEKV